MASNAAGEEVALLNQQVLQLAAREEWQQIADVVTRRNALLARLPLEDRKSALYAARACTEKLNDLAHAAKARCSEQLATLRQGRRAAASYRANL